MARYPGAVWRPVERFNPGGSIAQRITARRFVFHTAVSNSFTLWPYFNTAGNPCSHFYVREDGTIEQYVDTNYRAPANLDGNHDCISVESWDGAANPVPPWTSAQVVALRNLSAWVSTTHGIPRTVLPSSKNGLTGFGWHRQGIDPWRLAGTEYWSKATGKVCPGDARIAQIPAILTGASPEPNPPTITELAMFLAFGEDRGAALVGTGYFRGLDGEAYGILRSVPGMVTYSTNARGFDVIKAAVLQGTGADDPEMAALAARLSQDLVDEAALAAALAPLIVAELPDPTELTEAQMQQACEAAVRAVLGSLDNPAA